MFSNTRIKSYPCGLEKKQTFSKAIFNPNNIPVGRVKSRSNCPRLHRSDASKRAIDKVFDICMLNDFDLFVTFTLDSAKVDRYSVNDVARKFKNWVHNQAKRKDMIYCIIPELHKDGAIHFHGLIKGNFTLLDSGKSYNGKVIYNLFDWGLGFSTCVKLDENYERVVRYVTKYITKDSSKIFGNYYYAGGKGLVRDCVISYCNMDYDSIDSKEYICGYTAMRVKYY